MQRILTLAHRVPLSTAARLQQAQFSVAARETWGVFPREREGNSYAVNWSLTEHGVVSVGDSFRNARNSLLEQRSGGKVDGGKISVSKPTYMGNYKVEEAGDEITHQKFSELLSNQQEYLSSGVDLFVEDASVGSSTRGRLGVRVVSDSSAVAMVARNLLITSPAYKLDHRARFNGWNKDPRWIGVPEGHFDENDKWVDVNSPDQVSPGQRHIVVSVGGEGSHSAVQFVQVAGTIAGADVTIGGSAPLRAMVEAISLAAVGTINVQQADCIALPSCSIVKDGKSTLVVNADDSVVAAAHAAGALYGAYANLITPVGLSALFNGVICAAPAQSTVSKFSAAHVINGGLTAVALQPDNMAATPRTLVFFEAGATKKALTEEEAVTRLVGLTDDKKKATIEAFVKGAKCFVAGSAKDAM